MNPEQYRLCRSMRGTQAEVAEYLRVSKATIHRRETGKIAITHEATLAIMSMPMRKPYDPTPAPATAELFPDLAPAAAWHGKS